MLYIGYVYIRCLLDPSLGPPASTSQMNLSLKRKLSMLAVSLAPPLLLIFSVLGSILFGVASPTEAAAVGRAGLGGPGGGLPDAEYESAEECPFVHLAHHGHGHGHCLWGEDVHLAFSCTLSAEM